MNSSEKIVKNVLFLGPEDSQILKFLQSVEKGLVSTSEPVRPEFLDKHHVDIIVSHGYRHIIKKEILEKLPDRVINLHISILPWNRGADPNFWSFADNTPKGVTIHYVDEGLDTGDIIVQKEVTFSRGETFRFSYEKLQKKIQELFKANWQDIRAGKCPRIKQKGMGSFHYAKDKEKLFQLLNKGWNTPVSVLGK